jgi:hypothetical protein
MTSKHTGISGIQILARAREIHILENIQTSSSAHPASKSVTTRDLSMAVKWSWQSLITHSHLEPSSKISGAVPPLNLSATMAHIGTTVFYLYLPPMYISLKRLHPFWSYKGTLLYIPFPLHAHYMTLLFYLHYPITLTI